MPRPICSSTTEGGRAQRGYFAQVEEKKVSLQSTNTVRDMKTDKNAPSPLLLASAAFNGQGGPTVSGYEIALVFADKLMRLQTLMHFSS